MTDPLAGKKVAIIGLGLIGGSVARGLAALGVCREIVGVGRNEESLQKALADGTITAFSTDVARSCAGADLVLIAVPTMSVTAVFRELQPVFNDSMVVTDAASVKGAIVEAAKEIFGETPVNFVPGHPIAGSEHSGYGASSGNLYQGKKVILTPLPQTSPEAIALVRALWQAMGAEVIDMAVDHHDAVLAATSHLPHLLAYALVDTLSQQGASEEIFRYAAGGFRDFTRIASSDPQMWHDIFMTNGEATVEVLDKYIDDLQRLRRIILDRDSGKLMTTFRRAKKSRDRFLELFANGNPSKDAQH